ncbi:MAG TPA: RNA 2',3'-cyclic phosphodiesterase [Solirubrobacteraceae bacterium]|jgi:2'-5' RNA ligase|nr:RNA 2',3'-cyclic phosphodiesterase [Solirubrobacteraceae bacterium]
MTSRPPTARLFLAAELPGEVRAELSAWARAALAGPARTGVRILDPDTLHLTLCFLGSRPVEEIGAFGGALDALVGEPCEVSLGAPVWLPPRRPRALAVEVVDEHDALADLQLAAATAVEAVSSWTAERRRFRAHVTVARMRAGAAEPHRGELAATPPRRFRVERVSLYRSWLAPGGARYETLASREL